MIRFRFGSLAAVVLLIAACGGDSGGAPATTVAGSTVTTAVTTATTVPTGGMGLAGQAVVTVGDQTWEFSLDASTATCVYFAGHSISGVGFTTTPDGERATFENQTAVALSFALPVPGATDMEPTIIVTDNVNGVEWRAGSVGLLPNVPAGSSQVDEWEVGDGTGSATATFLEWDAASSGGAITSITGSIQASCG